jgi:hypothetical protein
MIYAVKMYAAKVISLAIFQEADLVTMGGMPEGFTEITQEKYNYLSENLTAFKKYNSVTGLLETDEDALGAFNTLKTSLIRASRIKEIARQRVIVDTLVELGETNEAARQQAALEAMTTAYAADYPEIIP